MAHTDEASGEFGREAERTREKVKQAEGELSPLLRDLGDSAEQKLLEEFRGRFAACDALDRESVATCKESLRALSDALTQRVSLPKR